MKQFKKFLENLNEEKELEIVKVHGKYAGDHWAYRKNKFFFQTNKIEDSVKGIGAKKGDIVLVRHDGYRLDKYSDYKIKVIDNDGRSEKI